MLVDHPQLPVRARQDATLLVHFGGDEGRAGPQRAHGPRDHARRDADGACGGHHVGQRAHDGYVAVSRHQDEEDAAAVEANVEDKGGHFARVLPQSPLVHVVVGPEGQSGGEEEVRHGQVQDEGVGEGFEILVLGQNHDDHDVSEQTEDDHDGEEHHGERRPEFYDAGFVAHLITAGRVVVVTEGVVAVAGGLVVVAGGLVVVARVIFCACVKGGVSCSHISTARRESLNLKRLCYNSEKIYINYSISTF